MAGTGSPPSIAEAGAKRPGPTVRRMTSPVLVGRDEELGALLEASANPPALVVVEGEPGVGKTRLVRELLSLPELEGRRSLVGHCQPLRDPHPFGPVIDALRGAARFRPRGELDPVAGALRPLVPELSELLPPALEPLEDRRSERHRVFRAVAELFRGLGPMICVLEDLHWAEDGTEDLVRFLASQLPDALSLVLTCRREGRSSALLELTGRLPAELSCRRISLDPLDPDEVRELVVSILDSEDVSADFSRDLHERTLGLPFVVEEVLNLLRERRHLAATKDGVAKAVLDELEVPTAVRDFALGRMEGLSPDARLAAEAAAVIAVPGSAELLRRTAGLSSARAAAGLSEALALGVLLEMDEGRFVLRHALAQRAVYEAIPTPQRRLFHRRAAEALEAGGSPRPLAQIAHHFKHADLAQKWLFYQEAAVDLAVSVGNDSDACDLLAEALDSRPAAFSARARMATKLGHAAVGSLRHHESIAILRRVLAEEDLPTEVRGEVRLYLGLLLCNQANQASAGEHELALAVPELRAKPGLAARAMAALAIPYGPNGHLSEHLAWITKAVEAAESAGDPALTTAVRINRATLLMDVGDPRAWSAVAELPTRPGSIEERRQFVRAACNLASAWTLSGHYRSAQEFLEQAQGLLPELDDSAFELGLRVNQMLLRWMRGEWAGIMESAQPLTHVDGSARHHSEEAELVCGLVLLARGKLRRASAHLKWAQKIAEQGGSLPLGAVAAGGLARLSLSRGEAEAACERTRAALEMIARKGVWIWATEVAPVAVEALVENGAHEEAAGLTRRFAHGIRGRDAPAATAALHTCRALLARGDGQTEQALRAFRRAERAWLALPRPYSAAQCREARALVLLESERGQGIDELSAALADYNALGASWDAGRVRRSLREHGVSRPWRSGRKGYGDRLSPREEEVLRLAELGRTKTEIAEELVLSPRTIESHLARAMHKTGARWQRVLAADDSE